MGGLQAYLNQQAQVPSSITTDIANILLDLAALNIEVDALPLGEVAYAEITANQGSITTITDVTGLSVTWTAVAGRVYEVTVQALILSSVADDICQLAITNAANTIQSWGAVSSRSPSAFGESVGCTKRVTGLSGAITWKARAARQAGTGNVTVIGDVTVPAFIKVVDMGV
jgi:hypothetical protein